MALDIFRERGVPLEKQQFTWRELVQAPTSKLDDDAFTRVRIILMNGLESEANRFSHACARMNRELQLPLARVRRVEQHQQTLVNWLLPADPPTSCSRFQFAFVCCMALCCAHVADRSGLPLPPTIASSARRQRSHRCATLDFVEVVCE